MSINQLLAYSINQLINQSINQSSINQSIIHQSIRQSIDQSINQSITCPKCNYASIVNLPEDVNFMWDRSNSIKAFQDQRLKRTGQQNTYCKTGKISSRRKCKQDANPFERRWGFSHDVTKTQTRKLLILLRFYFHDV